jgi:hypothetical protein
VFWRKNDIPSGVRQRFLNQPIGNFAGENA